MKQETFFNTQGGVGPYGERIDPPTNGTPTSAAAADSVRGVTGELRLRVLAAIRDAGADGLTGEEIADCAGMSQNTARPRCLELRGLGLVRDSGRTRPTRSGRQATVWVLNETEGER